MTCLCVQYIFTYFYMLAAMQGQHVELEVNPAGEVVAVQVDPPSGGQAASAGTNGHARLTLAAPTPWNSWAVSEQQFGQGANKAIQQQGCTQGFLRSCTTSLCLDLLSGPLSFGLVSCFHGQFFVCSFHSTAD